MSKKANTSELENHQQSATSFRKKEMLLVEIVSADDPAHTCNLKHHTADKNIFAIRVLQSKLLNAGCRNSALLWLGYEQQSTSTGCWVQHELLHFRSHAQHAGAFYTLEAQTRL